MPSLPLVQSVNATYFLQFLKHKNFQPTPVGKIVKVNGFDQHNFLVDINLIFSQMPCWFPIDRTQTVNQPLKFNVDNVWEVPTVQYSLDQAAYNIVKNIEATGEKINVFWSGGIDSTFIVNSFLKPLKSVDQLRVIYSPWSCYEHPEYMDFLKKYPTVETIDQSGEIYLDLALDGIFVTGNSGDEMHASVDQSFFETYGADAMSMPWQQFFESKNPDQNFIEFCKKYFELSGRPIDTVLEARWWFYAINKVTSITRELTIPFFITKDSKVPVDKIYSFFNCKDYERYIYWNINKILPTNSYSSWKQNLKDYSYEFDQCSHWYHNKIKTNSAQLQHYTEKKTFLNDTRWILILDDGTRIFTDNLPFFSAVEFDEKYSNTLDYLLNAPDQV
jgi:hypothetical protein